MEELLKRSTDKSGLTEVLETVHEGSCPSTYNFHLHTHCSDGQCHPINLFQQAIRLGLQGLAVTDHHSVDGYWAIHQWLQALEMPPQPLPQLWTGVEITADLLGNDVHVLALSFDPNAACLRPYLTGDSVRGERRRAEVVIDSIHQANGLAILAHPARYKKPPLPLVERGVELGLDGVEAFYCYGRDQPWMPSQPQTAEVEALGDRFQLLKSCGTDTHGLDITRRR